MNDYFILPTIGIVDIGISLHAVALFYVEVVNYRTKDEHWLYGYVDSFSGTRKLESVYDMS